MNFMLINELKSAIAGKKDLYPRLQILLEEENLDSQFKNVRISEYCNKDYFLNQDSEGRWIIEHYNNILRNNSWKIQHYVDYIYDDRDKAEAKFKELTNV